MSPEIVITATAALSPYGIGTAALAAGLQGQALPAATPVQGCHGRPVMARQVPDYDGRALLGVRSISQFDRLTLHVGVAVDEVLRGLGFADAKARAAQVPDDAIGIVLGSSGPLQSIMAFDLQTIADPRYVQPSLVPNVVFNVPASYAAIRHTMRGSAITLTDGPSSSLKAMALALAQLESGRLSLVLCGAAEEATPAYALYAQALAAQRGAPQPVLWEGAALFALETAAHAARHGRVPRAALVGCAQAFAPRDPQAALAQALHRLQATHPAAMREVSRVWADSAALAARAGLGALKVHELGRLQAELGTLPGALAVLDLVTDPAVGRGELALVVQAEADGCGAAALLRRF